MPARTQKKDSAAKRRAAAFKTLYSAYRVQSHRQVPLSSVLSCYSALQFSAQTQTYHKESLKEGRLDSAGGVAGGVSSRGLRGQDEASPALCAVSRRRLLHKNCSEAGRHVPECLVGSRELEACRRQAEEKPSPSNAAQERQAGEDAEQERQAGEDAAQERQSHQSQASHEMARGQRRHQRT